VAGEAPAQRRSAIAGRRSDSAGAEHDDAKVVVIVAHIAGIPIEETLAMAVPVLGAASAAIVATLRAHRRRLFKRK
jgi:ribosomal protein L12E/L44/L45/RPP1/RPP2